MAKNITITVNQINPFQTPFVVGEYETLFILIQRMNMKSQELLVV